MKKNTLAAVLCSTLPVAAGNHLSDIETVETGNHTCQFHKRLSSELESAPIAIQQGTEGKFVFPQLSEFLETVVEDTGIETIGTFVKATWPKSF